MVKTLEKKRYELQLIENGYIFSCSRLLDVEDPDYDLCLLLSPYGVITDAIENKAIVHNLLYQPIMRYIHDKDLNRFFRACKSHLNRSRITVRWRKDYATLLDLVKNVHIDLISFPKDVINSSNPDNQDVYEWAELRLVRKGQDIICFVRTQKYRLAKHRIDSILHIISHPLQVVHVTIDFWNYILQTTKKIVHYFANWVGIDLLNTNAQETTRSSLILGFILRICDLIYVCKNQK
jgi:hypothetical protein